jgi:hypothetical protein
MQILYIDMVKRTIAAQDNAAIKNYDGWMWWSVVRYSRAVVNPSGHAV